MQATLHGNSLCHGSFPSSYSTPAYNFLLCNEGWGKCFGFSPYPLRSQHAYVCSFLLLLRLTERYPSAPWCLLCTLSKDPDPSLGWASQVATA